MKKRILITGGAGFIGSHIAESLVKEGLKVIVYDNFSSGRIENLNLIRKEIEVIKADILDYKTLNKAMGKVDYVSHQAAQLEIFRCIENPIIDLQVNTVGTLNVFNAAIQNKVKKVINASSACVYGQAQYTPQDEGHPQNPNWPYGVSKLAAEKYCHLFSSYHGLKITSLRYSIVYGEREWLGRVLTMFIKRVLSNRPPVVFGNGKQLRDFIYVKDAVRLHNLCLFSPKADNKIYNVSTGIGTSIEKLAKLVTQIAEKDLRPIFENVREGSNSRFMVGRKRIPAELQKMVLSYRKAKKDMSWEPRVDLIEGIRREIEWVRRNPEVWRSKGIVHV